MQSIELVPDDVTAGRIRGQWAALERAGLPSQSRHTGASNRPHVTLALTDTVSGDVESGLLGALAGLPMPVTVGGLLLFGSSRYVLARSAIPSAELLIMQATVTASLPDGLDPHRTFGPGRWTPHVTLARRLTAQQVALALAALGDVPAISGELVRARLWDITAKRERWLDPVG